MTRKAVTFETMLQTIVVFAESKYGCRAKLAQHPQPDDDERPALQARLDDLQAQLDANPDDTDLADEVAELASRLTVQRFELIVGNGLDVRRKYTGQTLRDIALPLYADFNEDLRDSPAFG